MVKSLLISRVLSGAFLAGSTASAAVFVHAGPVHVAVGHPVGHVHPVYRPAAGHHAGPCVLASPGSAPRNPGEDRRRRGKRRPVRFLPSRYRSRQTRSPRASARGLLFAPHIGSQSPHIDIYLALTRMGVLVCDSKASSLPGAELGDPNERLLYSPPICCMIAPSPRPTRQHDSEK